VPVHGHYAPTRLTLYVMAYNTKLVAANEVPRGYGDLLQPRWNGRLALEADDVAWFASVVKSMGETPGISYFRRLAAMKPSMRKRDPVRPQCGCGVREAAACACAAHGGIWRTVRGVLSRV